MSLRPDLRVIADAIPRNARVLDVGCGDGALLAELRDRRGADARGIEIDVAAVTAALARGLSVVQGDADGDLRDYPTASVDYAILSQTLQTVRRPRAVLSELLRVGARAFVSFPNFAHWRVRWSLVRHGRMPVTPTLPLEWWDTPNIHLLTVRDFRALLALDGIRTEQAWFLAGGERLRAGAANARAEHAVFLLSRPPPNPARP